MCIRDSLKELATALNNDPIVATPVAALIGAKQSKITAVAPLTLAVAIYLTIDLSSYSTTSAQPKITTFASPILYNNNTLSFDSTVNTLANYYTKTTSGVNDLATMLTTTNRSANNVTANGVLSGSGVTPLLSPICSNFRASKSTAIFNSDRAIRYY